VLKVKNLSLKALQLINNILHANKVCVQDSEKAYKVFVTYNFTLMENAMDNNLEAVADAKNLYQMKMQELFRDSKPLLEAHELFNEHLAIKGQAIEQFKLQLRLGGCEFSAPLLSLLDEVIISYIQS